MDIAAWGISPQDTFRAIDALRMQLRSPVVLAYSDRPQTLERAVGVLRNRVFAKNPVSGGGVI